MITTEKTVTIEKPVAEVFRFMADFENDPAWRDEIDKIHHVGGPPTGEGAQYRQEIMWSGKKAETTFRVTEYRENGHIAFAGESGDVHASGRYDFMSQHGATQVKVRGEVDLTDVLDVAEDVIGDVVRKTGEQDLENLKQILEQGA